MNIIKNCINRYELNQYFNFKSRNLFSNEEKKTIKKLSEDVDSIITLIEEASNVAKAYDIDESLKLISCHSDKTIDINNFIKTKLYIYNKYSSFFSGSTSYRASRLYNKLWKKAMNQSIDNDLLPPDCINGDNTYLVYQINKIFSNLDEFNEVLYLKTTTVEKIVDLLGNDTRIFDIFKLESNDIEKIINNYSDIIKFIDFKALTPRSATTKYNYLDLINMGKSEEGKKVRAEIFNQLLSSSQEMLDISSISKLPDSFYKKILSNPDSYLDLCKKFLDSDSNLKYLIDILSNINPECEDTLINSFFNFDFENYNCEIMNTILSSIVHCDKSLETNSKRYKLKSEFFFGTEDEKGFLEDLGDKNIDNKESLVTILEFLDGDMKPSLLEAKIDAIKSTVTKDEFNDTDNLKKYLNFLDMPCRGEEITKKHIKARSDYFKIHSISEFIDKFNLHCSENTTLMNNILTRQKKKKNQNLTLNIIEEASNLDSSTFFKSIMVLSQIETKKSLKEFKNILNSTMFKNASNDEKDAILDSLFCANKDYGFNYKIKFTDEVKSLMDNEKEYPCKIKIDNKKFHGTIKKTTNQ